MATDGPHVKSQIPPEKRCTKCGEVKPLSKFYALATRPDGHRSQCKACSDAAKALYVQGIAARQEAHAEQWRRDHPGVADTAMTKRCAMCGQSKLLSAFCECISSLDGRQSACKACKKSRAKQWRALNVGRCRAYNTKRRRDPAARAADNEYARRRAREHPEARRAQNAANAALQSGKITRRPCAACGSTENVQMHHPDYDRPLDVQWLCARCHKQLHVDAEASQ